MKTPGQPSDQPGKTRDSIASRPVPRLLESAHSGDRLTSEELLTLFESATLAELLEAAADLRDQGHRNVVTYSRKLFLPLTHLCRDICHYCVFAQAPKPGEPAYMSVDQVLEQARRGAEAGCKEALFTLGDKPEERWSAARRALDDMGHASTLSYLEHVAEVVHNETGLLAHLNPGLMSGDELASLRRVSASMGIMLESTSERLLEKGHAHYGCPDKIPAARLATLNAAGEQHVPFTSGILIGIGETARERIESLVALREVHDRHGHLQEIIVQNFRAKPGTRMAAAPEPSFDDLLRTVALARLTFGPEMSIQVPPNLSELDQLADLIAAGINDWGGVSPVTPDFVNPEAPWPHLERLAQETEHAGKELLERLTIYPRYATEPERWLDESMRTPVLHLRDADGFARCETWSAGSSTETPAREAVLLSPASRSRYGHDSPSLASDLRTILDGALDQEPPGEAEIVRLFEARGDELVAVCEAANELRQRINGDTVTYVVNRNINYTNVCYFKCQFCAFSKGKLAENLRGKPYDLDHEEIARRVEEAWSRGATEVCMQGGIHPDYTGETYLDILRTVKEAAPGIHVHAFTPLEVWQGAQTLGLELQDYLRLLKEAGLGTLPGTAAEILDDSVRKDLCPDKIRTHQWLEVMEAAHGIGLRSTATIMFGHIDGPINWARHLLEVRQLAERTGGFTEMVPLPFVHMEAPIYLKGRARRGPTFREAILIHAVARLALHPAITNIQASWVKMGPQGVAHCLESGANDLGGTLMNESITRAAGAAHGQEMAPQLMERLIAEAGRKPAQRTTSYGEPDPERIATSFAAAPLQEILNTPAHKYERTRPPQLLRPGLE